MSVYAKGTILLDAKTLAAQKGLEAVAKSTEKVGKEIDKTSKKAKAFSAVANSMGNALMVGAVAGGAFLASSVKLAARVETLGVVVNKLGENAGYTNAQMDKLTQGVVSQGITLRHARTAIAMMAQANIDLAQSSDLARLAQDAAVIANLDSSETFQRLIQVVQTGNIRMARHLGLVVDFQSAYMKFAKANGTTTDKLDQLQKAQIRVTEVMRAGQAITGTYEAAMETAGKKVLSLNRHIEESRRIVGELFLPAFADAVDQVTKFLKGIQALDEGERASLSTTIAWTTGFAALSAGLLKAGVVIYTTVIPAIVGMGAALAVATGGITVLLGVLATLTVKAAAVTAATQATKQAIVDKVHAYAEEGKSLQEINRLIEDEAKLRGYGTGAIGLNTDANEASIYVTENLQHAITNLTQAELDLINTNRGIAEGAASSDKAMLASAGTMGLMTEATGIFYGALEDVDGKVEETAGEVVRLWDVAIPDPDAMIAGIMEYFAYMNSEIPLIVEEIQKIESAVREGTISQEEAVPLFESLSLALANEKIAMGTTASEAATEISDALGIGYWEAYDILNETVLTPLKELDGSTVTVTILQDIQTSLTQSAVDDARGLASGGMLGPGVNLVGEQGPELVINGRVFDTGTTLALLGSGAFGDMTKRAIDAGGGSNPPPPIVDPEWTGGAQSLAGDIGVPIDTYTSTTTAPTAAAAAATTAAVTSSVETAIAQVVEPALAAVAVAMPSSQEIAAGITEATMAQVQATMKQNAEILEVNKQQLEVLREQGTADDMGRAVKDGVQSIV